MASIIYDSTIDDMVKANIAFATDTFKVMLVTSTYTPSKTADLKRSAVTNEVVGTGYTAGGVASACTVAKNTGSNTETMTFASVNWPTSTITARAAVIYKSRGGASSADELVAYVDFGADITSTADTFTVTFSSPLTIQN
jgi:hypothetical protein